MLWDKIYGNNAFAAPRDTKAVSDGFIVSGIIRAYSASNDQCMVVKLNTSGEVVWQKEYNTNAVVQCSSIDELSTIFAVGAAYLSTAAGSQYDY